MKKVISACVDQILQFDSEQEVDKYVEQLSGKKQLFQIVWKNTLDNGTVQIRVKKQYNNTDFLQAVGLSECIVREPLLKEAKRLAGGSFSTPLIISAIENAPAADIVKKEGEK